MQLLFNPLSPNINMHILLSVLPTFFMVLVERICTNVRDISCLVIISFILDLYV